MTNTNSNNATLADFIWKNADVLWGNFKHVDFGKVILPFTLLRRLECVLEPTRTQVASTHQSMANQGVDMDLILPWGDPDSPKPGGLHFQFFFQCPSDL